MAFDHTSVMPEEAIQGLVTRPKGLYVDATLGGAGHTLRILDRFPEARVVAFDHDPVALAEARLRLDPFRERVTIIEENFRGMAERLQECGVGPVDGVLFDLGVSSPQLDRPERGFSYQHPESLLDMRMDLQNPLTAFRLVNTKPEAEISKILREYGEERWASRIASFIVRARAEEPIRTSGQLVELIKAAIPASARRTGGHPARRTFQALRIWVNDELGALEEGLHAAWRVVAPGGRVVAIAFHSLEDRIVKHQFRAWQQEGTGKLITRHPLSPDEKEVEVNPRSRSAKLRIVERV